MMCRPPAVITSRITSYNVCYTKLLRPFRWEGLNRKGQKVTGEMQADSITTVKAELRKQGVNVSKVRKKSQSIFSKHARNNFV